jgi:hypothetical protein
VIRITFRTPFLTGLIKIKRRIQSQLDNPGTQEAVREASPAHAGSRSHSPSCEGNGSFRKYGLHNRSFCKESKTPAANVKFAIFLMMASTSPGSALRIPVRLLRALRPHQGDMLPIIPGCNVSAMVRRASDPPHLSISSHCRPHRKCGRARPGPTDRTILECRST